MLKKTGAVAIAAAGLMMVGSPAFANDWDNDNNWDNNNGWDNNSWDHDWDEVEVFAEEENADQLGLLNFNEDSDLLSNLSLLCNNDINVLAIPILQGNDDGQLCGSSDDDGEHDGNEDDDD